VAMLVRDDRLLGNVESFAADLVAEGLREASVDLRFTTAVESVERDSDGTVRMSLNDGRTLDADELLVATGRVPRTADLGLDTVALEPGSWVASDTTGLVATADGDSWLYAVGDVNHRVLLTHMGKYQARACGDA